MVIEESVFINADRKRVWKTFTDLTCWAEWNRTARDIVSRSSTMEQGSRFRFCLRPFAIPIHIDPVIDEIVPYDRVVWSGRKYGIASRHEFLFRQQADGVLITSRERLIGLPLVLGGRAFTEKVVRELTVSMLEELREAAETAAAT
jgi:uncharacterized protein YndB with AHSA1/START domain